MGEGAELRLVQVAQQSRNLVVSFGSEPNRLYAFEGAPALTGAWEDLVNLQGDGGLLSISNAMGGELLFFRIARPSIAGSLSLGTTFPHLTNDVISLPDVVAGSPYAQDVSPNLSGVAPYSLDASSNLPPGMLVSIIHNHSAAAFFRVSSTGTGPVAGDQGVVRLRVLDAVGSQASRMLTFRTVPPPATIPAREVVLKAGALAANQLTAIEGILPLRWSLVSGALPAGVSLSADGTVSGQPTADAAEQDETGVYPTLVRVEDSYVDRVTGAPLPRAATARIVWRVRLSYRLNLHATRAGGPSLARSCQACHNEGFTPDLSSADATGLIDVNSGSGGECGSFWTYVTPGDLSLSLIYLKVTMPYCGSRMPLGGPYLNSQAVNRLGRWIQELTAEDTD